MTRCLGIVAWLCVSPGVALAALSVQPLGGPLTPAGLVNALVGGGLAVSNVTFTGVNIAAGTFAGGTGIIGFESGVILSSGSASSVIGPNNSDSRSTVSNLAGDPALTALVAPFQTHDAAVLEFDFVPCATVLTFEYVFASDEYNEFANSSVNDAFAFFVNGLNVATIPGSTVYISINTVNGGNPFGTNAQNPSLYVNNDKSDGGGSINTEMDGLTVVLTAVAPVNPAVTNHMKLAIADTGDWSYDSNVFLRAGSFLAGTSVLTVNKYGPSSAFVWDPVQYGIVVANNGTTTISNLEVWDTIPPGSGYGDSSPPAAVNGLVVSWTGLSLAPGASATVYLTVTVTGFPLGPNSASVGTTELTCGSSSMPPVVSAPVPVTVLRGQPLLRKEVVSGPFAPAGGAVTWRISWSNIGAGTAYGLTVTDTLPAGLAYAAPSLESWVPPDWLGGPAFSAEYAPAPGGPWTSGEPPDGTAGPLSLRWIVERAAPGTTGWVQFRTVLSTTLVAGSVAVNAASATVAYDATRYPAPPATVTVGAPALMPVKKATPGAAATGASVTYNLTLFNAGNDTATAVSLCDTLPAGATFVSAPGGVWDGAMVAWALPDLAPGATASVSITVVFSSTGWDVGPNRATGSCSNSVGVPVPSVTGPPATIFFLQPAIGILKEALRWPAPEGAALTYRLTVSSTGSDTATAVTVWDTLPAGGVFAGCGGGAGCVFDGTRTTWSLGDMPPGAQTVLTVTVSATGGMSCTNFAEVSFSDPTGGYAGRTASNTVCVPVVQATLVMTVTPAPTSVSAGQVVVYSVFITNTGDDTATSVVLLDSLPTAAAFWSATPAGGASPGGRAWALPPLGPGASATVFMSLMPPVPSCTGYTLWDYATLLYLNSGGVPRPVVQVQAVDVAVAGAGMTVALSPSATTAQEGGLVTFTITWANPCTDTAMNVRFWDTLPAGAAFVSATGGGLFGGATVFWDVPFVSPGSGGQVTFTVRAADDGGPDGLIAPFAATADFLTTGGAKVSAASLAATIFVATPLLTVAKTGPPSAPAEAPVLYRLTVVNTGGDSATGILLVDTLPSSLRYLAAQPPPASVTGIPGGGTLIVWSLSPLGTVAPGNRTVVELTCAAPAGDDEVPVANTAFATYRPPQPAAAGRGTAPSSWVVLVTPRLVVQAFPNPFDPRAGTMKFKGLPAHAVIRLFTMAGAQVRTLDTGASHRVEWDGRNAQGETIAPGIYLYLIEMDDGRGGRTSMKGKFGVVR